MRIAFEMTCRWHMLSRQDMIYLFHNIFHILEWDSSVTGADYKLEKIVA